jgi:hypothetical protein
MAVTSISEFLLRTALQRDPLAVGVRRQLVRLLRARDQHRQALELLEPWLQIAPDDVDALAEAARALRAAGGLRLEVDGLKLELAATEMMLSSVYDDG